MSHHLDVMNLNLKESQATSSYRLAVVTAVISFTVGLTLTEAKVCVHFYTLMVQNSLHTLKRNLEYLKGVIFNDEKI